MDDKGWVSDEPNVKGKMTDSRHWLGILNKKIEEAIAKGEPVSVRVR